MYFCYVDESGSDEMLDEEHPAASPVFALMGLIVPGDRQKSLIWDFLRLKKTLRPQLAGPKVKLSELVRAEIKGSDVRADVRDTTSRRRRRGGVRVMDQVLTLLETHQCGLIGKVVVKQPDVRMDQVGVYTSAVAELAASFNSQLSVAGDEGIMILDAQTKTKNVANVHTITTRKFRSGGDPLPHLVEAPLFGHSDTHVPLQIVDLVVSSMIFPMACRAYQGHLDWSVHCHPNYQEITARFGERLRALEYRYKDGGYRRGGVRVTDIAERRPSLALYGALPPGPGQTGPSTAEPNGEPQLPAVGSH